MDPRGEAYEKQEAEDAGKTSIGEGGVTEEGVRMRTGKRVGRAHGVSRESNFAQGNERICSQIGKKGKGTMKKGQA